MEDAITDLRVQMGVLVVKVGLIVALIALIGGAVTTVLVNSSVKAAAEKIIEQGKPDSGD